MAGRGMGAATKGGGCVGTGPKNRMISETSKTSGPVMMAKGGAVNQHKRMAMGKAAGGMMNRPAMPSQSNVGGAMRGQTRAAAMSGRAFAKGGVAKKKMRKGGCA